MRWFTISSLFLKESSLNVRYGAVILLLLQLCILGYVVYHMVEGKRGLLAFERLSQTHEVLRTQLDEQTQIRTMLQDNNRRLQPKSLDIDFLEERVRHVLGYTHPQDKVILTPENIRQLQKDLP